MSLNRGVVASCLLILVFSNLKSTTGLLSLATFLAISMTGNVWLVIFLERITREVSLHLPIHNGFIIFTDWKMSYKEGTFIYDIYVSFTVWTYPHFISETKAFLCCKVICISSSHSEVERELLLRSMYWIRI